MGKKENKMENVIKNIYSKHSAFRHIFAVQPHLVFTGAFCTHL